MGLDMYLEKRKRGGETDVYGNVIDRTELMYWRKANQIRGYFTRTLRNFQDNGWTPVRKEHLQQLAYLCNEVLFDHSKADELLPCQEGFFFGTYEYDDWYFQQIQETLEGIKPIINNFDKMEDDGYELFYGEWW